MFYPPPLFENKICAPEGLSHVLNSLKRPLVFTNGCFDILHRGHVTYLAQARALGESLLVALNTDASVRLLDKGANRPINTLGDRVALVAALESVSWVTWFDEKTPAELLDKIKPDILVKGGDWPIADIVGAEHILSCGGKVFSIPFLHHTSTTKLLALIRHRADP